MNQQLLKFLTNFIIESDAIEGIRADPQLVKVQLEERMDKGHVGALILLESWAQSKKIISESMVRQIQGFITAEQHTKLGGSKLQQKYIGQYRSVNLSIGGRLAPSPVLVPSLMQSWISRLVSWQEWNLDTTVESLCSIARFHYEYEHIHPFADGNGRSGRALVYYLLRYSAINPFIFSNSDKYNTYYRCFDDSEAMCRYFIQKSKIQKSLS